jgi:hypothetical protein
MFRKLSIALIELLIIIYIKIFKIMSTKKDKQTNGTQKPIKQLMASQIGCEFMPQGNRAISNSHVNKLKRSIQDYGILKGIVLIKTNMFGVGATNIERFYIADGQHLYTAASTLGRLHELPVHVIEKSFKEVSEIVELVAKLNSTQSNWKLINFIGAYAGSGNVHYGTLLQKTGQYKLSPITCAVIFGGTTHTTAAKRIKEGTWKTIINMERANEIASYLEDIIPTFELSTYGRTLELFTFYFGQWYAPNIYDHVKFKKYLQKNILILKEGNQQHIESLINSFTL